MGRVIAVLVAAGALSAGCGSQPSASTSLGSILDRPGPNVALTPGAQEFVPGEVRFPFLVIRNDARPVVRPTATLWAATSEHGKPFARVRATLEPIGVPGRSEAAFGGVRSLYVAHLRLPKARRYWLVAQPDGARIQAFWTLDVRPRGQSVGVGAKAPRSDTPTLAGEPASRITTSRPPDLPLLRHSIAGSLAAHAPFVVTFATPKFCTSRTCGPVVDVLEAVRRRFEPRGVRFIHVEVYRDNDPAKGYDRWMREWGLTSEPWVFLVGRDGRVKAKFEGSVSAAELAAAVRAKLL